MEEVTAAGLRLLVESQQPYFARRPIRAFNEAAWQRLSLFVREHIWEDCAPINVFRVVGVRRPEFQGMAWGDFFRLGARMGLNLRLLEENPAYYRNQAKKVPAMSFLQVDGGDYYVDADGEHRTCLAKFLFHCTRGALLYGVEVNRYWLDHSAVALDLALLARGIQARPVSRKISQEDYPGWKLERFEVEFAVRRQGREHIVSQAAAWQVLERPSWRRRLMDKLKQAAPVCGALERDVPGA